MPQMLLLGSLPRGRPPARIPVLLVFGAIDDLWINSNGEYIIVDYKATSKTDRDKFNATLKFDITLIPYKGNTDWIENALIKLHKCLNSKEIPQSAPDCDYCNYRDAASEAIG